MIQKNEIITKINALKSYSYATAPAYQTYFDALFVPLEIAVNSYYARNNSSLNSTLKELAFWWYCDIARRTTIYEHSFAKGLPTDYPTGYDNLEDCFYKFAELLTISNSTFYAAWIIGTPESGDTGSGQVSISNSYLDKWVAEITAAIQGDITNVQNLSDWVQYASGNADLVSLFEDEGKITEHLSIKEIANQIYNAKKMLNVITTLNLTVYVPSYIKISNSEKFNAL